ncbi:hypothetical protein PF010_g26890 [Phytophthora fragariae]|nr:hypothetical protein PF009_g12879 [Phytophthora fragariae]KAE9068872.1 hypothetical protein PF010_g26890 [Phytophthora fragariae]KAE9141301.1 hypothetical protein PF006_g13228 [Phytophthora fragariae]KAE9338787.1 hypothetical protein PF008_g11904 [Phytophthora fragariae]
MDVFSKIGFGVELVTFKNTFDQGGDHEFLEAFNVVASVAFGVRIQTPTLGVWSLEKSVGSSTFVNSLHFNSWAPER